MKPSDVLSNCCSDSVSVKADRTEGTAYYVCDRCNNACDGVIPSRIKTFQVPLPSGQIGALTVPFPMADEDYKALSAMLETLKAGLVS
jgi:hypothetical protein